MRACSLLAIPAPPPGREALPGGIADDLSQINLSAWAEAVQDVAAGMLGLPPELSNTLSPGVQDLLARLETATRVPYCHNCYLLGANCWCLGAPMTTAASSSTTGTLWSEITDPTPLIGVSADMPQQGAPSIAPPPGLTLPVAGSIWNLPIPDFPALPRLLEGLGQQHPPTGRGACLEAQLRAVNERRANADVMPKPSVKVEHKNL